ncbi:FAD-dependent oxidoreductase [Rhizobium leguminosarum]|uniref:FAD-dependent oxidoreductase n=1 Tax=Rhizobium leguminosarum TaxID=384 RepID=UPI001AE316A3|nr:FAD-dependent oxidoreductase [Rhizobium leguminosarum]MBP2449137.1 D-amino-acid dehydrogenase [Rhizobium leguminosarum]
MARVAVIGAGVVGVATAYLLAKAGHGVTLIDVSAGPGQGASAGNAAQLSWAYGDAMASPALLRHLPAIAMGRDPAFRIRWQLDPDFFRWGLRFLANTPFRRWWANTRDVLTLAELSRCELAALLAETDISFDYRVAGKLHLYPDRASVWAAEAGISGKKTLGLEQRLVSRAEAESIEPALRRYQAEIAGAVHTPGDALGDAAAFCCQLTSHMVERYQLSTLFGRRVTGFARNANRLTALSFADREPLPADIAVVAAGPQLRLLGHELAEARSVRPVRGYSLTVPASSVTPLVSLTDVSRKLAFASIGDRFRVAGLADVDPPGSGFDSDRFDTLRKSAAAVLPDAFEGAENLMQWSGERPTTPSSRPIIAASRHLRGVYYNVGHGMLGWTLSLGSARRLVDLIGAGDN